MDTGKKTSLLMISLICAESILYFFANMQKVLVPGATFNQLLKLFPGTASTQISQLGVAFILAYATANFIVGILSDRFGGDRVIAVGGAILAIGSIFSALTVSWHWLCFFRVLTGIGAASIFLALTHDISQIAGKSFPIILGLILMIGFSGSIVGATPFIAAVEKFGYSSTMLVSGLAILFFHLIYLIFFNRPHEHFADPAVRFVPRTYISSMNRSNVFHIIALSMNFSVFFTLQTIIGKKFLEDFCRLDARHAGWVFTASMFIAAANGFITALISRILQNKKMPILYYATFGTMLNTFVILLALAMNIKNPYLYCTILILIASTGNVGPISYARLQATNPPEKFGTVSSVSNAMAYVFSSIFGLVIGLLMDIFDPQVVDGIKIYGRYSYMLVFGFFFVCNLICSFLISNLSETGMAKQDQ